ncbi:MULTISPECIES: hypothetical protein [unclassified Pseudomonas]|nr:MULTISPECIES: hypothetical protein [unclassified Pseudomonas]MDG9922783.1 hypothetical protein [Pseudomonas sp. GD04045]MDH0036936.1 hypothetical protein [Pseudomonas sp. GD04019]
MSRTTVTMLALPPVALLLALAWWGWSRGGLALLQLGMSLC